MQTRLPWTRWNAPARPLCAALVLLLAPAAWADDDLERTIPTEPGGTLRIDLPGGNIEVETHSEDSVELDGYASGAFEFRVDVDDRRGEITVRGSRRGFSFPLFGGRVELQARVPEVFSLDVKTAGGRIDVQDLQGDVQATTSGGRIDLEEIIGDVDVTTSGGRIQAQEIEGDLSARTSGGSIRVSEVTGRVNARTSGGSIRVKEAGGEVIANTSGGPVEVRFDGVPEGRLRTSGGSIDVEVDESASFDLHAETSGGRVEIDDELEFRGESKRSKFDGQVGGGGPPLDVRTSGGNVRIRVR